MNNDRIKRILILALPIIGGMVSQNVLNLVDMAMVGTLGDPALAAVGLGGFVTFTSQALILGISTGVQATTSRRKGEGKLDRMAVSLNAAIVLVLLVAPLLSALLFVAVPHFYPLLNDDPLVMKEGIPYLQVRVLAIVFVGMNFSFRGYWNAVDLSKLYMSTLLVMHSSNILLNYALIFGKLGAPELGVTGAGMATAISTVIGLATYVFLGFKYARSNGFLCIKPTKQEFFTLIKLSIPNSLQQLFFASGFTVLFWIIGLVGTAELAAANVLINVALVAILPGIGLGLSSATLVGQALGRKDIKDARQWGWDVVKVGVISLGILGIPMWLVPDLILGRFIYNEETLALARMPMRLVGITMAFESVGLILMNALLGAGDSKRVMMVSIGTQWLLFLPLAYLLGPILGYGLLAIWLLQGSYRSLQALVFAFMWRNDRWESIEV